MVRKIDSKSAITHRFRLPSAKNDSTVTSESTLEHQLALRLEYTPSIFAFQEQPATYQVPFDGKVINVTPDFKVTWDPELALAPEFIEVKPSRRAKKERVSARLDAAKHYIEDLGFTYVVLTEQDIQRSKQVIQNCNFLNPFKWQSRNRAEQLRDLAPSQPVPCSKWAETVGDVQLVIEMIAHQLVFCDFYQPLTPDTVIRPLQDGDFAYMYA